jgi:hypothetical protein
VPLLQILRSASETSASIEVCTNFTERLNSASTLLFFQRFTNRQRFEGCRPRSAHRYRCDQANNNSNAPPPLTWPKTPPAMPISVRPPSLPSSGNTSLASGLAPYRKLDDGSGSTVADSVGGNAGTWNGTFGRQSLSHQVSGDSLHKTGIFVEVTGDFRQFGQKERRTGSPETKSNARKAGIYGQFSPPLGS